MYGAARFIGTRINRGIDWLAANFAEYFGEGVTTHKCLLRTVTNSVFPKRESVCAIETDLVKYAPVGPLRSW
jgi:hypothetical protein